MNRDIIEWVIVGGAIIAGLWSSMAIKDMLMERIEDEHRTTQSVLADYRERG
jgi:hypothetical protein